MKMNSTNKKMGNSSSRQILTSNPPDVGSDLVSSQTKTLPTAVTTPKSIQGGMLKAIHDKTASLKSMLKLRSSTRKNH